MERGFSSADTNIYEEWPESGPVQLRQVNAHLCLRPRNVLPRQSAAQPGADGHYSDAEQIAVLCLRLNFAMSIFNSWVGLGQLGLNLPATGLRDTPLHLNSYTAVADPARPGTLMASRPLRRGRVVALSCPLSRTSDGVATPNIVLGRMPAYISLRAACYPFCSWSRCTDSKVLVKRTSVLLEL